MDISRFARGLRYLRDDENESELQEKLEAVSTAIQNLSGNPAEPTYQTNLSKALGDLETAVAEVIDTYNPAQLALIKELGAEPFFTDQLVTQIKISITENPMTPATTAALVARIVKKRQIYVNEVKSTLEGIEGFGFDKDPIKEGEAEIGFELPRTIFENSFSEFIKELHVILRVMKVFAEVETGNAATIELSTISTTDPLIFLNAPPVIITSLALSVGWVINNWKKLEEIRKLRAETAKLQAFKDSEVAEFFDKKVNETIEKSVELKVKQLLKDSPLDQPRKMELTSELSWALKALFSRIERGMKVEVRVSIPESAAGEEEQAARISELNAANAAAEQLVFPSASDAPILALSAPAEGKTDTAN